MSKQPDERSSQAEQAKGMIASNANEESGQEDQTEFKELISKIKKRDSLKLPEHIEKMEHLECEMKECSKYDMTKERDGEDKRVQMIKKGIEVLEEGETNEVKQGICCVCTFSEFRRLIEKNFSLVDLIPGSLTDLYGRAVFNNCDELASQILEKMSKTSKKDVRDLHCSENEYKPAKYTIHTLLEKNMKKTVEAVLDSLVEDDDSSQLTPQKRIYAELVDNDSRGLPPDVTMSLYGRETSGLHALTYFKDNKDFLNHEAVKTLIDQKWENYGRRNFIIEATFFLLSIFMITFSVAVGCQTPDPLVYDTPIHVLRAVCEVGTIAFVSYQLLDEITQMIVLGSLYWRDIFNLFDLLSIVCVLAVIPLRLLDVNEQWHVYVFAYVSWTSRILEYSAVSEQTAVFVKIFYVIVTRDIILFVVLFFIILLMFSGSYQLALRAEGHLAQSNYTTSMLSIVFIGIQTLVEQQPSIDYTEDTDKWFSIVVMVVYLTVCVIIMLNLLIARLSDRYQRMHDNRERDLYVSRAWVLTRLERHTWCFHEWKRVKKHSTKNAEPKRNARRGEREDVMNGRITHLENTLKLNARISRLEGTLKQTSSDLQNLIREIGELKTVATVDATPSDGEINC
ncbi:unnamed protein product [Owenia fusiformis]|uniref:Uncharacterized protein n=1 Tax=Owenia fusiformis TaxID=6347 RepID=A0A8J1UQH9_OWEFU|nr:unnamed protein product [Owenia fusiformis]